MFFFWVILVIATITDVFAAPSNRTCEIVAKSEADVELNLRISVCGDSIILDSSSEASASSRVTENGQFEVSSNAYAAVDADGYLIHASASSEAATGFDIKDGQLTYKDSGDFYAVPQGGSQYRISIREVATASIKITVSAKVTEEVSIVDDESASIEGPPVTTTCLSPRAAPAIDTVTVTVTESPVSTPTVAVPGDIRATATASAGVHYQTGTPFVRRGITTILK